MKQVFYKGLLALTIAFGVTSCDKNELDDIAAPTVGVVENDEYSKVSFGESGFGIQVPKLKGATNEASKTASEFSHIYSTTEQVLVISDGTSDLYTGAYDAGDISSIVPSSIILANGTGYTATSSNESNGSTDVVSSFLPYTSTVGFDLSATANIQLVASLERGFVIVNVEDAVEGSRVTGASANGVALLDGGDGDYYGYLLAGPHSFVATYTLDGVATAVTASQDVVIGVAYTVTLDLDAEPIAVVGSDVSTSTATAFEHEIGTEVAGRDINTDDDFLDSLERIITSTQATLNDENVGEPVVTDGPWYVILDTDISASSVTVTSTEAAEEMNVNSDSDRDDIISRIITTTTTSLDDVAQENPAITMSDWIILLDRSGLGLTEDTIPGNTPPVVYVDREYSIYGPAYAANTEDFVQTREVSNSADAESFDPDVAEESLSRDVVVTSETTLAAVVGTAGVLTYTGNVGVLVIGTHDVAIPALVADAPDAWVADGDTTGGDITFTNDGSPVLEYSYDSGAFGSLVDAQAAADAAITAEGETVVMIQVQSVQSRLRQVSAVIQPEIYVVNGDQDGDIEAGDVRETQVVTAAVVDGVADDAAPVAGSDVSYTVTNAITPPAPNVWITDDQGTAEDPSDDTFTNADYPGVVLLIQYNVTAAKFELVVTGSSANITRLATAAGNDEAAYAAAVIEGKAYIAGL